MLDSNHRKNRGFLLQEKPILFFSLFSILPLLASSIVNYAELFYISIVSLVISLILYRGVLKEKGLRVFLFLLSLYACWIILSALMHYKVLGTLDPTTLITVFRHNAVWGRGNIMNTTIVYLLFPLFFALAILFLKSTKWKNRILYALFLLILPSLALALYQGVVDVSFLNHPHFISLKRVAGLAGDPNAFGLSLYLLFPVSILAILMIGDDWKRLILVILSFLVVCCLLFSGSITGLIGVMAFIFIFPSIMAVTLQTMTKAKRRLLFFSPFILLSPFLLIYLIVNVATTSYKKELPFASTSTFTRLNTLYEDYKTQGIEYVAAKTGRLNLGYNAYRLTRISPIAGWGPGGFANNLQNVRFRSRDLGFYSLIDNANNHYLQMSSELGVLGAAFNLFFHLFPLWMIFRIRRNIDDPNEKIAVGLVSLTVCIMMLLYLAGPHTMSASVAWIFVVLLAFLVVTAFEHGYTFTRVVVGILYGLLLLSSVAFIIGTYYHLSGPEGYKSIREAEWWPYKYEKNCYNSEFSDLYGELRWCKQNASLQIPLRQTRLDRLELKFVVLHPDITAEPVRVKYGGKDGPIHDLLFKDYTAQKVVIPLSGDYLYEIANYIAPETMVRFAVLSLDVSRTWVPKNVGVSSDTRELGVAVIIPDLTH